MECVELAPAVEPRHTSDSGSKLHALHTLRETRPPPCSAGAICPLFPRKICAEKQHLRIYCSARRGIFEIVARRAEDRRALPAVTDRLPSGPFLIASIW